MGEPRQLAIDAPTGGVPRARRPIWSGDATWLSRVGSAPGIGVLLGLHALLAQAMDRAPTLAAVHALAALGVGLAWALSGRRVERVAYVAAYVMGAEVLWRMTEAPVAWEFGKYAVVALLGAALIRDPRAARRFSLPIVYFVCLLPSIWLTVQAFGFSEAARQAVSFNLSGPLALAVCALFFARCSLSWQQLRVLVWCAVAPLVGIASLALGGVLTAEDAYAVQISSDAASGGFGANQVSGALGMGALLCVLLAVRDDDRALRPLAAGLALWFTAQSLLTLSRGGVWAAAIGLLLGLAHERPAARPRLRALVGSAAAVLAAGGLALALHAFTGGALLHRFRDLDTTGRDRLALADLRLWWAHPLLGVGAGRSQYHRPMIDETRTAAQTRSGGARRRRARQAPAQARIVAPHTEFTRLVAEHGMLGLLANALLVAMIWQAYRRAPSQSARAWIAALAGLAFAGMAHSAMRTVAPAFLVGLATMDWRHALPAGGGLSAGDERGPPRG